MNIFSKILLLFFAIIFSVDLHSQNDKMPGYDEVAKHFFYTYELPSVFPNNVFEFHKKKDGWYVVEKEFDSKQVIKTQLIWTKKSNKFNALSYNIIIDTSLSNSNFSDNKNYTGITDFELYAFDRILFYGYIGWDWDVIQKVHPGPSISQFEIESLARAYSNYATGFLYDQYGHHYENGDSARKKISSNTPISSYRAIKFAEYIKQSIKYYRLLAERYPDYETRVGKPSIKFSGENMFAWSTLKMIGFEKLASDFLKSGFYNDSILHNSEALLQGASLNSIILTSGDNQTYSLWYLQETKNFRKDVKVIDINLLGLNRYITFLKEKEHIKFSTPDSIFHHLSFGVLYKHPTKTSKTSVSIDTLITQVIHNYVPVNAISSYSTSTDSIRYLSNETFFFNSHKPSNTGEISISEVATLKLGNYLYGSDLLLLDLINMNRSSRPIFFTFEHELLSPVLITEKKLFRFNGPE